MSYSEKIKELREKHNLSQSELAEKLFVTRQAVSLWEQGKAEPSKDSLMILKELYGISVDEWMDVAEAEEGNSAMESKKPTIKKIVLLIVCIVLCISFVTVATIDLVFLFRCVCVCQVNQILERFHNSPFQNPNPTSIRENLPIVRDCLLG